MNRWFRETFLPSLFERAGTCKSLWLTRRQTQVCVDNMTMHTRRYENKYTGDSGTHLSYDCEWRGRHVTFEYSKLNGCGTITFAMTPEEAERVAREHDAAKAQRERELLKNMARRRPERFRERLQEAEEKVRKWEQELAEDRAELEEAEANQDAEGLYVLPGLIESDMRRLAEARQELAKMMEAMEAIA